jgi:WD40 repeat protein
MSPRSHSRLMANESSLVLGQSVRVWDAKTGEQLRELQGHTDYVTSVSFSPDGERIVSGSGTNQCGCGMQRRASS